MRTAGARSQAPMQVTCSSVKRPSYVVSPSLMSSSRSSVEIRRCESTRLTRQAGEQQTWIGYFARGTGES